MTKDIELLRESIKDGDHLRCNFDDGTPAIFVAAVYEFDEAIDLLVAGGMSPSEPTDARSLTPGTTALHHVAGLPRRVDILKHLIKLGADVNAKDEHGLTPLRTASLMENTEGMEALRAAGATMNGVAKKMREPRKRQGRQNYRSEDFGR